MNSGGNVYAVHSKGKSLQDNDKLSFTIIILCTIAHNVKLREKLSILIDLEVMYHSICMKL